MIRCAHCQGRHATTADVRECAAFQAYMADEQAREARYPHVDFPDGDTFARIVPADDFPAADAAHMAAIETHPDAF